jgi:putative phosphoserine phosphatase/1-acylglycerol-3-phosphate O-acyltransferase
MHESLTREIDSAPKGARVGAFFDLDRTIIAGFSAFALLANRIMSGRMTVGGFMKTVLASLRYETGGIGFSAMVNETSELLAGFDEAEYSALGDKIFEGCFAGHVYEVEILEPIETKNWKPEDLDSHIATIRGAYLEALALD